MESEVIYPLAPPYSRTQALSSTTFNLPPLDGSLTIPEIYDWNLKQSPDHTLFEYIDDDEQVQVIKWPRAVRAMHKTARLIRQRMGTPVDSILNSEERKTVVAIIASADTITYFTTIMGILRTGYICFPISPRNSPAAVAHLLSKTSTSHVLVGSEQAFQDLISAALASLKAEKGKYKEPSVSQIPVFEDLYVQNWQDSPETPPPFAKPNLEENCLIVHSSGSTAFPKPVYWSHRWCLGIAMATRLLRNDWCDVRLGSHFAAMFHAMGLSLTTWAPTGGIIINTFKPKSPAITPTPDSVMQGTIANKSDIVFCTPTFIEVWSRNPDYVKHMVKMKGILYGGGPLNKDVGNDLASKGVTLCNAYGSTETGVLTNFDAKDDPMAWEYVVVAPLIKAVFAPRGNGLSEMIVLSHEYYMPCIINTKYEGVDAYATSDLFEPHPTKSGLWKVVGRTDDQIMHSTGEKTNPGPLESLINQDPHIQSSVMFGRGKFHAGVLIDPKPAYKIDPSDAEKLAEFRSLIWPTIETMNAFAPQHSRIFKEMILVADPKKPVTYTAKNTPRRLHTINAYSAEIDSLYEAVEETIQTEIHPPTIWNPFNTLEFVRTLVLNVLKKVVDDEDDLYEHGCDSLQTTWIRNSLLHALRNSAKVETCTIPANFVYQNPTILQLANFIYPITSGGNSETSTLTEFDAMQALLAKYSSDFPIHAPSLPSPDSRIVLLTGSTGGLGSNLLAQLVSHSDVDRVYLLNRKSENGVSLKDRQIQAFMDRGLSIELLESKKVVLLEGDPGKVNFGLALDTFEMLRDTVTHIIHNAWRVNFNVSLPSFESNIRGLRGLVDLALSSPLPSPPRLIFTSTVGVLRNADTSNGPLAETPIDAEIAVGSGYSESKWVSEKILETAKEKTPLQPVIVRVGQLSGGENGAWNKSEWLPSIVRSAPYVNCLPSSSEIVSWLPVHIAASAIIDFLDSSDTVVHLVHPKPVSWSTIFESLSEALHVPIVSYNGWLKRLEDSRENSTESEVELMKKIPVLKLLEFFKEVGKTRDLNGNQENEITGFNGFSGVEGLNIPLLAVNNAVRGSLTLADPNLPQLGDGDVKKWLAYWRMI